MDEPSFIDSVLSASAHIAATQRHTLKPRYATHTQASKQPKTAAIPWSKSLRAGLHRGTPKAAQTMPASPPRQRHAAWWAAMPPGAAAPPSAHTPARQRKPNLLAVHTPHAHIGPVWSQDNTAQQGSSAQARRPASPTPLRAMTIQTLANSFMLPSARTVDSAADHPFPSQPSQPCSASSGESSNSVSRVSRSHSSTRARRAREPGHVHRHSAGAAPQPTPSNVLHMSAATTPAAEQRQPAPARLGAHQPAHRVHSASISSFDEDSLLALYSETPTLARSVANSRACEEPGMSVLSRIMALPRAVAPVAPVRTQHLPTEPSMSPPAPASPARSAAAGDSCVLPAQPMLTPKPVHVTSSMPPPTAGSVCGDGEQATPSQPAAPCSPASPSHTTPAAVATPRKLPDQARWPARSPARPAPLPPRLDVPSLATHNERIASQLARAQRAAANCRALYSTLQLSHRLNMSARVASSAQLRPPPQPAAPKTPGLGLHVMQLRETLAGDLHSSALAPVNGRAAAPRYDEHVLASQSHVRFARPLHTPAPAVPVPASMPSPSRQAQPQPAASRHSPSSISSSDDSPMPAPQPIAPAHRAALHERARELAAKVDLPVSPGVIWWRCLQREQRQHARVQQ